MPSRGWSIAPKVRNLKAQGRAAHPGRIWLIGDETHLGRSRFDDVPLGLRCTTEWALRVLDNCNRATETAKQINMVGNSADTQNRAADVVADATEVVVHFVACGPILQKPMTLLCGKNDVQVNLRERLWHEYTHRVSVIQPLRGKPGASVLSPGCAARPWATRFSTFGAYTRSPTRPAVKGVVPLAIEPGQKLLWP
jgi:hypothetical protein